MPDLGEQFRSDLYERLYSRMSQEYQFLVFGCLTSA